MIHVSTKYACVKPLKNKRPKTVLYGFVEIINKPKRKSNKLWVEQEKDVYNNPIQKWFNDNDIFMYPTHN